MDEEANVECLPKGEKKRCFLDYDIGSGIVFSIDSSVHQVHGDKAQKGTKDVVGEDSAWGTRFDGIVNADSDATPGLFPRSILNHVFGSIVTANSPAPVWSIDECPSPLDQNLKQRILEEWKTIRFQSVIFGKNSFDQLKCCCETSSSDVFQCLACEWT